MGLLERWDARNQEVLERQNRTSIESWAQATNRRPPHWVVVVCWAYVVAGVISMLVGIVTRDVETVARGAISVLLWGMPLSLVYYARRNRR